jgi:tetratricopeptide (TPR) repeat protein
LCGNELPPKELFDAQSARSINAFRALMAHAESRLNQEERDILIGLAEIGQPIAKAMATKIFGNSVGKLAARNLIEEVDGDVYVHHLVSQYFGASDQLTKADSVSVARHLKERAISRSEPLGVIRAGKLLAQAGRPDDAVETLAEGWEAVRDLGFLEAYLKILASIPQQGLLGPRLQILSARARMRQGSVTHVKEELERLGQERDVWTRVRALASLVYVYSQLEDWKKVVETFDALKRTSAGPEHLLPAGSLAATGMLKVGQIAEAEKLARSLLARLKRDQEPERQGELHRLLAHTSAQMGDLKQAVAEATLAAGLFHTAGDLYHAATAQGFIGDLYRETGDFELAQQAFKKFHELAQKWGDKNLIQLAELSEAWVSLDIGDLTQAQKRIQAVEKELSASAGRRIRRYLGAARALLEAGRGHHEEAVAMFSKVLEAWEGSGQRAVTDMLKARLVRSLIATGKIDEASTMVDEALTRLDPKTASFRVAAFLRESALIRLKRKDPKRAISELTQACKLFAQGGNRREEAHTLYRIAHASFEDGDMATCEARVKEALELAQRIRHTRVVALARELQGRLALSRDQIRQAVSGAKEAHTALRRMGDELGTLHVAESLLRAQVVAGDLAAAIKLGPKVSDEAERLEIREVRIRAIALTGAALLRKGRPDAAVRCFREIPDGAVSLGTLALMWRLGEGLAAASGDMKEAVARRERWVAAIRRLPENQQGLLLHSIEQLGLPPNERYQFRTATGTRLVGNEQLGLVDPSSYALYIDMQSGRAFNAGKAVEVPTGEAQKLFTQLVTASPEAVTYEQACRMLFNEVPEKKVEQKVKPVLKDMLKALAKGIDIETENGSMRLVVPKKFAFILPASLTVESLSIEQKKIMKILQQKGSTPLDKLEEKLKLERVAAKKAVDGLLKTGLVESVKEGKAQAIKLA